jgi:hypothetical protein
MESLPFLSPIGDHVACASPDKRFADRQVRLEYRDDPVLLQRKLPIERFGAAWSIACNSFLSRTILIVSMI